MASPIVPVSLFSDAALQKAVDDAMDRLPPGTKGGFLFHVDLKDAGIAVQKKGEHWSVSLAAGITYDGPLNFEAGLYVAGHW